RPTAGECSRIWEKFAGRCHVWGGGIRSRRVAACRREKPLVAGRRALPAGIVWRLDRRGRRPGPNILKPNRGPRQRPAAPAPRALRPAPLAARRGPPVGGRPGRLRRRSQRPLQPSALCPRFRSTPITGLGFDRSKVPAMVQTLPAEDFSRVYSPNVVETFVQ